MGIVVIPTLDHRSTTSMRALLTSTLTTKPIYHIVNVTCTKCGSPQTCLPQLLHAYAQKHAARTARQQLVWTVWP
jgi:hypothetical protein